MGCTDSSASSISPYSHNLKGKDSYISETKDPRDQTEEQIQTFMIDGKSSQNRLTEAHSPSIEEFEGFYTRSGNDPKRFLEIVQEKMSHLYINLSRHTLQQLIGGNLTTTQSKLLLSSEILFTYMKVMKAVGNKTNFAFDSKMLNMFDSAQSSMVSYMKVKYPRSAASFVPAQLTKQFKSFDLVEMPENDILIASDIHFGSDDEKILKLQVKKFINRLIDQVDQKFIPFQKLLTQKVFVVTKQGKSYTVPNKIGRKIPENVQNLPQEDDSTLEFKSPEIFRIILKWLNDMQDYIFHPDEQTKEKQNFKTCIISENKNIFDYVSSDELENDLPILVKYLVEFEAQYEVEVKQLKKYIQLFNHNLIKILAKAEIQQKYVPKKQAELIKYAMYNTRLLSWMLGQKLMIVMKKLIKTSQFFEAETGLKLDLIKFNVTDLLRARMQGNKFEIIKVFQNLKALEKQNKIKIVKIKNRFETAMNDVMIIFKIEQSFLICQLQLLLSDGSARNEKLKHIEMLNHFFYELERSPYGVVAEVAALIGFKDNKITFQEKITFDKLKLFKISDCQKNHKQDVSQIFVQKLPFICSQCSTYYDSLQNNFLYKICTKCNQYLCSKCIINGNTKIQKDFLRQRISEKLKQELKRVSVLQDYEIRTKFTQNIKEAKFADSQNNYDRIEAFFNAQNVKFLRQISKKNSVVTAKQIQKYLEETDEDQTKKIKYFTLGKFLGGELVFYSLIWKRNFGIKYSFKLTERKKIKDIDYRPNDFIIVHNDNLNKKAFNEVQDNSPLIMYKNYQSSAQNVTVRCIDIYTSEMKVCSLYLPIDIKRKDENDGWDSEKDNNYNDKKQFVYESISDLRKHLPNLRQANETYNIGNQGIEDKHLIYFKTVDWKNLIKSVNLYNNKIKDISIILSNLPNLQKLLVSRNEITSINFVSKLPNFKKLVASQNQIQKITQISNVPNIVDITAESNNIKQFQFNVVFPELRTLNLSLNSIHKFSSFYSKNYPKLINLSLGGEYVSQQTKQKQLVFELLTLQNLKLSQVAAETVKFVNLNNLSFLSISDIQGNGIEFCKLPKLRKCTIYNCRSQAEEDLQNNRLSLSKLLNQDLNDLQEMILYFVWKFERLPELKFPKAKLIKMDNVSISDISNLEKSVLPNLEQLQFTSNEITFLPTLNMKKLKKLIITQQNISDASNLSHWELQSLENLQLGNLSQDTTIPQFNNISVQSFQVHGGSFAENLPLSNEKLQSFILHSVNCTNFPELNFQNLKTIQLISCSSVSLDKLSTSKMPKVTSIVAQSLTLKQNNESLPVMNFPSLEDLNLSYCGVKNIDNLSKSLLPSLKNLQLQQNQIFKFPQMNFEKLISLNLENGIIQDMTLMEKSNLPCLQNFYCSTNKIQVFPIIVCQKLKRLDMNYCNIKNVQNLKKCKLPLLENLSLFQNPLTVFPELDCPNLSQIYLSFSQIKDISKFSKCDLGSLQQLDLSCIELEDKKLPKLSLKSLTKLNLDDSKIDDLSQLSHSKLPNLEELLINRIVATKIPKMKFPKLKYIRANSTEGNDDIGIIDISELKQSDLPELQVLELQYNKIQQIPKLSFPNLKNLYVMGNKITKLGKFLQSDLPKLDMFYVYDNEITQLPFGKKLKPPSVYFRKGKVQNFETLRQYAGLIQNIYYHDGQINQWPSGLIFKKVKLFQFERCNLNDASVLTIMENQFTELEDLSFDGNNIQAMPKIKAPKLKNLRLQRNGLKDFTFLLKSDIPCLDLLTLQQNTIQDIPDFPFPQVSYVYFNSNPIKDITCFSKYKFDKLITLVFYDLKIKKVCKLIAPNLRDLYFNKNQIQSIDNLIGSVLTLVYLLKMEDNLISDISPLGKIDFPSLTTLHLQRNKIKKLPQLSTAPNLSSLFLQDNIIESVQQFLKTTHSIYQLSFSAKSAKVEQLRGKITKVYENLTLNITPNDT